MLKKAYYNGHDLTQHMTIKRVTTPFSGKITNTYGALPGTNHHWLQSSSRGQCVVEIEAVIKDDVLHHVDELNKILSVDEDGWLFFADQPDRKLLCRLDGTVTPSSRIAWATIKLKFVSPNSYWNATEGYKEARFANNSVIVDNNGTAETYPIVTVDFKADCGFLALQGPDGGMYLGNPEEIDKVDLKPSELALNKVFTDVNGWQKVTGPTQFWDQYLEKYFHQHASSPVFTSWGMKPNVAELPANESYWQGHGYYKDFERGNLEVEADNFIIKSRVDMMDLSGRTNNTGVYWIMVSDSENKPVMAIYLQDQGLNKNEITISCMIASSDNPDPKKLTLVEIGKNIVSGLWNGIKSMWGNMVNWVGEKANGLVSSVKGVFGIKSPSRRMRDEVGVHLPTGIAAGIEQSAGAIDEAMDDVKSRIMFDPSMAYTVHQNVNVEEHEEEMPLYQRETLSLLRALVAKEGNTYLDGREVSRGLSEPLNTYNQVNDLQNKRMRGEGFGFA